MAFATLPGQVGADGQGRNSPYTKHLLRQLVVPGVPVEEVFKRVRTAVVQETGGSNVRRTGTPVPRSFALSKGRPHSRRRLSHRAAGGGRSASATPPSEPSKTLRNSLGMEFVLIPAGEFMMGRTMDDRDAETSPSGADQYALFTWGSMK